MPRPHRPPLDITPPAVQRFRRGRGRRYVPDVVEAVRKQVEGTIYSQAEIAARNSIAQSTVDRWIRRYGWQRPERAPLSTKLIATARSGLGPRIAAAASRLAAVAARLAGAESPSVAADPGSRERAKAVAAGARRLAQHLGRIDDPDPPRLWKPQRRRRDLPREAALVAEARDLVENTAMKQSDIALRLGLSKPTLIAWIQLGGWIRPIDAPARYGPPGQSRRRVLRNEQRAEARYRLAEAERIIAGLEERLGACFETAGAAGLLSTTQVGEGPLACQACITCEAAFEHLRAAVAFVQRRGPGPAAARSARSAARP